jgi:hypothetical protein
MKLPLALFSLFLSCMSLTGLEGQDMRADLKKLDNAQKQALLEYMRSRGGDIDQEIRQMYEQLQPAEQQKALLYLNLLAQSGEKPAGAMVRWNRDTIYYKKIEEGTILLDSFTVTNTGTYPYIIKSGKASCDCTILQAPEFPVMPGESAVVRVEFNSTNKIGKVRAGIVLFDNSEPNHRSILFLDGEIVPRKAKKPGE